MQSICFIHKVSEASRSREAISFQKKAKRQEKKRKNKDISSATELLRDN